MTDLIDYRYGALAARGISEETCRLFGYGQGEYSGAPCHVMNYRDPETGEVVAQKIRWADKAKGMPWLGNGRNPPLFGQWLTARSRKKLVVTEGEIDAMAMSQAQDNKWPVVSVPLGAQGAAKAFKQHLSWLSTFESVVIMFDMDDPGRAAAVECARLLPPGRARIARLPLKDASDMLKAGRQAELVAAMWDAEVYRPDGIVSGQRIIDRLRNRPAVTCYPYPDCMPALNEKTYGIRLGELDTWTSGTGMGKTTVIKQLQHWFWQTTPFNQAIIHLEEPLEDSAESLVGMHLGRRLNLPDVREATPQEEIDRAGEELFLSKDTNGVDRIHLYDAFGSVEDESLYDLIRYCAQALDCKIVWLDHLSILVSGMGEDGDERRRIDSIMHNLKSLTQELGIYIGLICHLKKAAGNRSFEGGDVPNLDDLRGSGGIKQLSNGVFFLSRDQQHANRIARNTSLVTVGKCRFTGRTGAADWLLYDDATGRMVPGTDPELTAAFPDEDNKAAPDAAF